MTGWGVSLQTGFFGFPDLGVVFGEADGARPRDGFMMKSVRDINSQCIELGLDSILPNHVYIVLVYSAFRA